MATGRRRFYPPGATSLDVSETLAARGKPLDRQTGRLRLLRQTTKG